MKAESPKRLPTLNRLLLQSHLGLTLALVAVALLIGGWALRAALLDQATAQVEIAAINALRQLDDNRRELTVVARLLGERPTLTRLLRQKRIKEAEVFLDTYARSARLHHARIEQDGKILVETGTPPPQPGIEGLQFAAVDDTPWRVVGGQIEGQAGVRLWLSQKVPSRALVADRDSRLAVTLWSPDRLLAADANTDRALAALRHVLATGERELVTDLPEFAAVRMEPLRTREGDVAAVLSVGVSRDTVRREVAGWFGLLSLGVVGLAVLVAALSARLAGHISRPFAELASRSYRLGFGNLDAELPAQQYSLAEADALLRNLEGMRVNLLHITERERARREELDGVLNSVDEGIVVLDGERRIRYANQQFQQLFDGQDVVGKHCSEVLHPNTGTENHRCDAECPLIRARQHGVAQVAELRLGDSRVHNLVMHSAFASDSRQVAIVREETPAEASRSMRDAILANLAHEFQTPLAAQVAAVELLRDHLRDSADGHARRLVDAQYRGVLRLSQLVENLLDSVRLDSGEMRLRREVVDLPGVVRDALALMQPLLDQRDQQIVASLPVPPRPIIGDAQRLVQVVVNLLANANKFAPDQSRIWLEVVWGDQYVSLWVEDEGAGLPPFANKADLFAPFRRSPNEEPSARGSGLGLAIVRALVEKHGGEVVVASPRHGSGARFGIVLPFADQDAS